VDSHHPDLERVVRGRRVSRLLYGVSEPTEAWDLHPQDDGILGMGLLEDSAEIVAALVSVPASRVAACCPMTCGEGLLAWACPNTRCTRLGSLPRALV